MNALGALERKLRERESSDYALPLTQCPQWIGGGMRDVSNCLFDIGGSMVWRPVPEARTGTPSEAAPPFRCSRLGARSIGDCRHPATPPEAMKLPAQRDVR